MGESARRRGNLWWGAQKVCESARQKRKPRLGGTKATTKCPSEEKTKAGGH